MTQTATYANPSLLNQGFLFVFKFGPHVQNQKLENRTTSTSLDLRLLDYAVLSITQQNIGPQNFLLTERSR